tara:strand:+ start:280 stop:486 length:207 start_codon:yes stop_codon:yes gene_type:complete
LAYYGKYQSPTDLLRDDSLSRDRKIEMLESWRDDKDAYMRASDEGMQGDDHAERLRKIEKALSALQET